MAVYFEGELPQPGKLRLGYREVKRLFYEGAQVWPDGLRVRVDAGSYSLSGKPVTLRRTHRLAAAAGAYALTGNTVDFQKTMLMAAGTGSYVLTGNAAELRTRRIAADAGVYSLQGQSANLLAAHVLAAGAGTYVLSGVAAGLGKTLMMPAATGSYVLSGQATSFLRALSMPAAAGSFVLGGVAAGLLVGRKMPAAAGSYGLAGQAAGLMRARRVAADAGSYALTGNAAALDYDGGSSAITMTAGNAFSVAFGFGGPGNPFGVTFGSVSGEPLAGQTLLMLYSTSGNNAIIFTGDATAAMAGKSVTVDGSGPYALTSIAYDSGAGYSSATIDNGGAGNLFADLGNYIVSIG